MDLQNISYFTIKNSHFYNNTALKYLNDGSEVIKGRFGIKTVEVTTTLIENSSFENNYIV